MYLDCAAEAVPLWEILSEPEGVPDPVSGPATPPRPEDYCAARRAGVHDRRRKRGKTIQRLGGARHPRPLARVPGARGGGGAQLGACRAPGTTKSGHPMGMGGGLHAECGLLPRGAKPRVSRSLALCIDIFICIFMFMIICIFLVFSLSLSLDIDAKHDLYDA